MAHLIREIICPSTLIYTCLHSIALACTHLCSPVLTCTCLCTLYEFILAHTCLSSLLHVWYAFTFSHTHFVHLFSLVRVYFHSFTFVLTFTGSTLVTRAHFHQYTSCACLHPPALICAHLGSFMPTCTRLCLPTLIYTHPHLFASACTRLCLCFQRHALVFNGTFIFDGSHLTSTVFPQW